MTYSGDDFYDDDVTSGPAPERPHPVVYEHVTKPDAGGRSLRYFDHEALPARYTPRICRRCGKPIRVTA